MIYPITTLGRLLSNVVINSPDFLMKVVSKMIHVDVALNKILIFVDH